MILHYLSWPKTFFQTINKVIRKHESHWEVFTWSLVETPVCCYQERDKDKQYTLTLQSHLTDRKQTGESVGTRTLAHYHWHNKLMHSLCHSYNFNRSFHFASNIHTHTWTWLSAYTHQLIKLFAKHSKHVKQMTLLMNWTIINYNAHITSTLPVPSQQYACRPLHFTPTCHWLQNVLHQLFLHLTFIYHFIVGVIGAQLMTSQSVSSIFLCSPLPSRTWWTPGLSIPWCCLPTSSSVCLLFPFTVLCKMVLARPDAWDTCL